MRLPFRLHLTNLLLLLGFGALAGSFALPHLTAERVARIEGRAEEIVAMLADLVRDAAVLTGADDADARADLLARARARGAELGHPPAWLLEPWPGATGDDRLGYVCKHYLFLVARTPPPPTAMAAPALRERPIEVWGWPRAEEGSGRSVFQNRDGAAWFCRNLNGRYLGESRAPEPGLGRARTSGPAEWYWGTDGERWIARRS